MLKRYSKIKFNQFRFLIARLAGILVVATAPPIANIIFGKPYPGGGKHAGWDLGGGWIVYCDSNFGPYTMGYLAIFVLTGITVAFVYLVTASLVYYFLRQKTIRFRICAEFIVLLGYIVPLVYAGITARFS